MKYIHLSIIICCFIFSPVYGTTNLTKKTNKLQTIINKIDKLKNNLFSIARKRSYIQNNLKNTELKIGDLAKKINYNQAQINTKHQQLKKVKHQQIKYQQQLNIQKKLLAKQIYASYILGRQPYIKIILNQEDPTKLSRYLYYYAQFNQARMNIIHKIERLTQNIKSTTKSIKTQTHKLQTMQHTYRQHRIAFVHEKNRRQQLLVKTSKELNNKNKQLDKLLKDKQHLTNIIQELKTEYSYGYIPGKSFAQMRGKLHWPINNAKIIQSYGQSMVNGKMHATGMLLQAAAGTKIHAIFPGKVIFADWLHGFGLLIIVQHGKHYITLYGRNQSLYVKRGDAINAGQVIATVGNSGGFQNSALYFEIRHNTDPINPTNWLQRA
ncbi:MAG: peptidoglycan DD-metalloendopeptidase family protein [Gammaproteobacteria bacterium]|jgi:septal ring factor EnvC (AmiA/AmiB activator)